MAKFTGRPGPSPAPRASGDPLTAATEAHKAGRTADAERLYKRVLRASPANVRALQLYGLLKAQLKEYDAAEQLLGKALLLDPRMVAAHQDLIWTLMQQNKVEEAIARCEVALAIAPGHLAITHNLAICLKAAGRRAEALALLEKTVASHPDFAPGLSMLAQTHEEAGNVAEAMRWFRQAASADPQNAESRASMGYGLLVTGNAAEALTWLESALAIAPWKVRALAMKTLALAELGRTDDERWLADPFRLGHTHNLADGECSAGELRELNQALSVFASNHPSMREDPPENATYQAWHSKSLLHEKDPALARLKQFIAAALERRVKALATEDPAHPFVRGLPKAFQLDIWAVKMTGGSKMTPHIHTSGWLSGVYYVDVPDVVNDPAAGEAGWLKLGPPQNDIVLTKPTITRTIRPEPGLMVTFPSYIWHDTVPLPAGIAGQRLCLAFDLRPRTG